MTKKKGNVYAVQVGEKKHLIRALTKAGARNHVADREIKVELASQDQLIEAKPGDIEDATPAPAADPALAAGVSTDPGSVATAAAPESASAPDPTGAQAGSPPPTWADSAKQSDPPFAGVRSTDGCIP